MTQPTKAELLQALMLAGRMARAAFAVDCATVRDLHDALAELRTARQAYDDLVIGEWASGNPRSNATAKALDGYDDAE